MNDEYFSEWSVRVWPPSPMLIAVLVIAFVIIAVIVVAVMRWSGSALASQSQDYHGTRNYPMEALADRITAELRVLIGEPLTGCWRAANMQIFEFGPVHRSVNRKGEEVESSDLRLHVQCRWRMVDGARILFGRDDLLRPADERIPPDDFDWDMDDSVLDDVQRKWFAEHRGAPLSVVSATGDAYGGFRISLDEDVVLEGFPCDSDRGEYSEHWRLLGHHSDGPHFVITGHGVEGDSY